jgi:hypothetical protein
MRGNKCLSLYVTPFGSDRLCESDWTYMFHVCKMTAVEVLSYSFDILRKHKFVWPPATCYILYMALC